MYAFPPAPIVPKTLQKIKDSHCTTVILITSQPRLDRCYYNSAFVLPYRWPTFESVVDMAADPLRDSSSNVYNLQWKAFAKWANDKGIQSQDLSYITMAEYLVHLFTQNKQVNTIKVHRASIASFLKTLNLPTKLQEDAIHIVIRRMSILRPRTQEVLQRWHLSVVLNGLMKPPFAINGLDRDLPLELQSYKTAFLIALATGAWGSELVTLSCAPDNMDFKILDSGANHVSIGMAPKFIPTNQRPEIIPKPLEFPGIRHGSLDLERLLCPVRVLGLYQIRSADRAKEDPQQKLFVHYSPDPGSSLPTSDVG